jgi:hypothetical protein
MSDAQLRPCPFCGGTDVIIEGQGQLWRGVKGYSDPQYFTLTHHGELAGDGFQKCHVVFRGRTHDEVLTYWNGS